MKLKIESQRAWSNLIDNELDSRLKEGFKKFNLEEIDKANYKEYYIEINNIEEIIELIRLSDELIGNKTTSENYIKISDLENPTITIIKNNGF